METDGAYCKTNVKRIAADATKYLALLLVLVFGVFLRVKLIEGSRFLDSWIDLRILQSTAALTLEDVNVYDRELVRTSPAAEQVRLDPNYFTETGSSELYFDDFMSRNLPINTLVLSFIGYHENTAEHFRQLFALADLALFVLACVLMVDIRGRLLM